jgi:hypothetical protein
MPDLWLHAEPVLVWHGRPRHHFKESSVKLIVFGCLLSMFPAIAWSRCGAVPNEPQKLECSTIGPVVNGGKGHFWGEWHRVKSEAIPKDYRLESVSFHLVGPHPCTANITYDKDGKPFGTVTDFFNAVAHSVSGITNVPISTVTATANKGVGSWAECEEVTRTATSVEWRFHFQGWTEERRYIDNKGVHWDSVPVEIGQNAILRTTWTKAAP